MKNSIKLFSRNLLVYGKHAKMLNELREHLNENISVGIFYSNVEMWYTAALVGCIFDKRAEPCTDNKSISTSIHTEQINTHYNRLTYVYKLVILTAKNTYDNNEEAINRALRNPYHPDNEALFMSFFFGGLEYLHERFFKVRKPTIDNILTEMTLLIDSFEIEDSNECPFADY